MPEGPVPANVANGNGIEISGASLLNIAVMDFSESVTRVEAKRLTRALLHYHLDGKELLSRALFKSFSNLGSETRD